MRELWGYRELLYFLVWRDVKIRYKQTVLGAAWAIIQPLFAMIVFTLFFGRFAKMPSDGIPYPLFAYCALLPWTYFSGALTNAANSMVGNADLIRKVYFPRVTIPASSTLSGLVDFGIGFLFLVGMMVYYRIPPRRELLLWPLLIFLLVILAMGAGMFLAALNAKYRDIKYATPFAIQLLLFLTPIIYPLSIIPPRFRIFVALNPLSGVIESFRASLLTGRPVDWQALEISAVLTVIIFALGASYFRRMERTFADVI